VSVARDFSPREPIAQPDGLPTKPFSAWLRERERDAAVNAETLAALIAHLIAEGVIDADWRSA